MDNLKKYQNAIIDLLETYAAVPFSNTPTVEKQVIADRERNRFQAIAFGWENEDLLVHTTFLHFEIKDGKVWVQQNWTEIQVATELIERGVAKQDIVLGFVPEYAREEAEMAFD